MLPTKPNILILLFSLFFHFANSELKNVSAEISYVYRA
jgi:hypothetical protein